jgi:hypothetical protein
MTGIRYKHLVHYDEKSEKVTISRVLESGATHLYTEISRDQLDAQQRTFEGLAKALGSALLADTPGLRDRD